MKALIVVDIQYDFCPNGALAVPEGDQVIPVINELRKAFELVVFTQDWHPATHKSFAANHAGHKIGDTVEVAGLPQVLWPTHCVQNTPGAELHRDLIRKPDEPIFRKGTDPEIDSYSAFYDNAHRRSTGLGDFLRGRGVTEVVIVGLATDYCVKYSALDALHDGYAVTVVTAACRGVELKPGDSARALNEIRAKGGTVVARLTC